ncbi:expressed unknown protein [Seminavis robusta]|uniref:Orc1-like AAA ATPase domain-containing protein n=1 Tax=Seminavis robusta TaxID=568900 RepID=A0A9N8DLT0_9STRA|nr:expressed unknown protein [Seminavis robusta]|eukprot:Sro215_g089080.1 n/a (1076) ;mRNA; f:54786-58515
MQSGAISTSSGVGTNMGSPWMNDEKEQQGPNHIRRRSRDHGLSPKAKRIDWKGSTLYDRQEQEEKLMAAYKRSIQQSEIVLITGASGTGKTVLAKTLLPHVKADGGLMFKGKFDQNQYVTESSPCFSAFQHFARIIVARGDEEAKMVRKAIEAELGQGEIDLLLEIIPEMAELLTPEEWKIIVSKREEQAATSTGMDSSSHTSRDLDFDLSDSPSKVASVYRRFLRCVSSPERPIVLFLDDLQWADDTTLTILSQMANETPDENKNAGFLFLGTVRGNEVAVYSQLSVVLRKLDDAGVVINDIQVNNLSPEGLNEMISSVLGLSSTESQPLAEVVYKQTQGNAFFSIQYLRSLKQEGILYHTGDHDGAPGKWAWQDDALILSLEESGHDDNNDLIVTLLSHKMREVSSDVKEVMKVAACLGTEFSEDLLCHSGAAAAIQVSFALDVAEEMGFITYDCEAGTGHFNHDKFQETFYSLIPDEDKATYHLQIGRNLRRQLTPSNVKKNLSVVLSQITFGLDQMTDPEEREEWACLCLRAGRKAGKTAAFTSGLEYVELGIKLLGRRNWRDQYNLSLDLYSAAAEMAYCCGDHDKVDELTSAILDNALGSDDKLTAQVTKITSLAARFQTRAAIDYCIDILRGMGHSFPRKPTVPRIVIAIIKLRLLLSRYSDADIMRLPALDDSKTSSAMVVINQLFNLVQQERLEFSILIALRLVQLTLKHGLSPISSGSFAFYGAALARTGHTNEAFRYAQLSFRILEKYPSEPWMARCLLVTAGTSICMKVPLPDILPNLMKGHQLGLKCGDLEAGFLCAVWYSLIRIFIGNPISTVAKRLHHLMQLCRDYNQDLTFTMAAYCHQFCLNLMGQGKEPLVVTGDYVDEVETGEEALQSHRIMFRACAACMKYMLAIYHDQYDAAEAFRKDRRLLFLPYNRTAVPTMGLLHVFHEGLVAVSSGRIRVARNRLKILQRSMVADCPETVTHKVYLLDAEILAYGGHHDDALCRYELSIKYAAKNGYTNEGGLANEMAGRMLERYGHQRSKALVFYSQARDLYSSWGCECKVASMDEAIATLHLNGHGEK